MNQERRSIQDIIPPARSKPIRERVKHTEESVSEEQKLPLKPKRAKRSTGMVGLIGIAIAVLLIVGAAFGIVSTMFHRAEVTITPYAFQVTVADTFVAAPDGELLGYTNVSFEATESKEVPSTSSEFVEDRASGTITIHNEYSTQSQRLITNTRFETTDGLIFRIKSPVTVPGYTTSGGAKVPGSVEVTVYADEPGEAYNGTVEHLTIPGLAGSPQYDAMYAKGIGSMTGGFIGEKAVVEESIRDAAVQELKAQLDRTVRAGLAERLSDDQFSIGDMVTVQFIVEPDKSTADGAEVAVRALATVPAFSESQLASLVAAEGGVVFEAPLTVTNREALTLQASRQAEDSSRIDVLISGDAHLTATINTEALVRDLAGKGQEAVGSVLVRYPGIQDMGLSVYPFWRQALPEDTERFSVTFDE